MIDGFIKEIFIDIGDLTDEDATFTPKDKKYFYPSFTQRYFGSIGVKILDMFCSLCGYSREISKW